METELPEEEIGLFPNSVRAVGLAARQPWVDGHCERVYGLRRAEALRNEAQEKGEDLGWRVELVLHWRLAVDRHCEAYGVRVG